MRIGVVAGPDAGHAFPAIALGVRLHARGHDVRVVCGAQWEAAARRDGLDYAVIPLFASDGRDDDFGHVLWGRGARLAPVVADLLREFQPDLVVADTVTVPGWFAADLLDLPRVELIPHLLQDQSRALPPVGTGLGPGRTPIGRSRDALFRRLAARSIRQGRDDCVAARRSIGLPDEGRPALRLVATLPALEPVRPDWPADTHIVGPLEWDPATVNLAPTPGEEPLVLLADSSASGRAQTLLDVAVAGLRNVRLVCTRFEPWSGDVAWVCAGPGRQAPLLDHASVVVCAGGHGMVAKALARGVPLVVVPGPGDQWANGQAVSRLGAGVVVRPQRLHPARLSAAVDRVLRDGSYAAAARRAAASLDALPGNLAVNLVESVR